MSNNNDIVRYTDEGPIYTYVPEGYVIYNPSGEKKHGPLNPYFPGEKLPGNGILIDDIEWVLQDYDSWHASYGNLAIRKPGEELTEQEEEQRLEEAKRKLRQLLEQEKGEEEQEIDIEINFEDEDEQHLEEEKEESEEEHEELKEEQPREQEEQKEVEEEEREELEGEEELEEGLDFLDEFKEDLNDFLETLDIDDVVEEKEEKEEDWIDVDISFDDEEDILEESEEDTQEESEREIEEYTEEEFPEDVFQISEEEREKLAILKLLEDSRDVIGKLLRRFDEALKKDYFVSLDELVEQEQLEEILSWVKLAEELYKKLDEYYYEENLDEYVLRDLFRQVDDVSSFLEKALNIFDDAHWMMIEWTDSHVAGFGKYLFSKVIGFLRSRFSKLADSSREFKNCIEKENQEECKKRIFDTIKEDSKLNLLKGRFLKAPAHYNLFADAASVVKVMNKKSTITWAAAQDIPYLAGNLLLYLLRNFDLNHSSDGSLELTISDDSEEITYRFSPSASQLLILLKSLSAQDKSIDGKLLFEMLARLSAESTVSYTTFNYEGKADYQEEVSLFEFLLRSLGFNKNDVNFIMLETFRPGGIIDIAMSTKDSIKDSLRDVYATRMVRQVSETFLSRDHSSDLNFVKNSIRFWKDRFKEEAEEFNEDIDEMHDFEDEEEHYSEISEEDVLEEITETEDQTEREGKRTYVDVTKETEEITSEILSDLKEDYKEAKIKAKNLDDAILELLGVNSLDASITFSVLLDSIGRNSLMFRNGTKVLNIFLRLLSFIDKDGEILGKISNNVRNEVTKDIIDLITAISRAGKDKEKVLVRKNSETLNSLVESLYQLSQQVRENKDSIKDNNRFVIDALKNIIVLSAVSSLYIQKNGEISNMAAVLSSHTEEILDGIFGTENKPGRIWEESLEEFGDTKQLASFIKKSLLKAYIPLNLGNVRKLGVGELPFSFSEGPIDFSKIKEILDSVEIDGENFKFKAAKNVSISGDPEEFFRGIVTLALKEVSETDESGDVSDFASIKFNYSGDNYELLIRRTNEGEEGEESNVGGRKTESVKGWVVDVVKGDEIVFSENLTQYEFSILNRAPSLSGKEASKALKELLRSILGRLEKENIKDKLSNIPVIENVSEAEEDTSEAEESSEPETEEELDESQESAIVEQEDQEHTQDAEEQTTRQEVEEKESVAEFISERESAENLEEAKTERTEEKKEKGNKQNTKKEGSQKTKEKLTKQTKEPKTKKEKKKSQKDLKVDEKLESIKEEDIKGTVEKAVKSKPSKAKQAKTVAKLHEAEKKVKTGVMANFSRHVTPDGIYYSTFTNFEEATFGDITEALNQKGIPSILVYGQRGDDFDGAVIVERINNKTYRLTLAPSMDFSSAIFGNNDRQKAGKKIERIASIALSSKDLEALKGANIHSVMSELLKTNKVLGNPVFEGGGGFEDLPLLARAQKDIEKMTLGDVLSEDENTQMGTKFSFALDEETGEDIFDYNVHVDRNSAKLVVKDSAGNVVYERVFLGQDLESLKKVSIKDLFDAERIRREVIEAYKERKKRQKEEEKRRRLKEFLTSETKELSFSGLGVKGRYEVSGDKVHYYFEKGGRNYSLTVPLKNIEEADDFEDVFREEIKRKVEEEQKRVEQSSSIGEEDFKFALEDLFSGKINDLRIKTERGFVLKLKEKGKDEVSFELYDSKGRFIKSISQNKKALLSGGLISLARVFQVLAKPIAVDSDKFVSFINYTPKREVDSNQSITEEKVESDDTEKQTENTEKRSENTNVKEVEESGNKEENVENKEEKREEEKANQETSIEKEKKEEKEEREEGAKIHIDKDALKSAIDEAIGNYSTNFEAFYGDRPVSALLGFDGESTFTVVLPDRDGNSKRVVIDATEHCPDHDVFDITDELLECISNAIMKKISTA
jgi:hypothetical protein